MPFHSRTGIVTVIAFTSVMQFPSCVTLLRQAEQVHRVDRGDRDGVAEA